jgi:hypothetical protein
VRAELLTSVVLGEHRGDSEEGGRRFEVTGNQVDTQFLPNATLTKTLITHCAAIIITYVVVYQEAAYRRITSRTRIRTCTSIDLSILL